MSEFSIGDHVQITSDQAAYTRGCYQGHDGTVKAVAFVSLPVGEIVHLLFVSVNTWPLDDYFVGGWWYQPGELKKLSK